MRTPRVGRWLEYAAASHRRRAVALVAAAAAGFAAAGTIAAFASPAVPIATSFGSPDGDGRTRLVVTASAGIDDATLTALLAMPGVDSAQRIFDGSVLVAGYGISPAGLTAHVPGTTVTADPTGTVTGSASISDPM